MLVVVHVPQSWPELVFGLSQLIGLVIAAALSVVVLNLSHYPFRRHH